MAMKLAMMSAAQRHRELVADLAAQCAALCKAQVVRVRGLAAANQARLLRNKADMVLVADPARLRQGSALLSTMREGGLFAWPGRTRSVREDVWSD